MNWNNYEDCPRCNYPLKTEKNYNLNETIKRADIHYCSICNWSGVKNILEDTIKELPPNEFVREKEWANKTAKRLLPSQTLKIRFVNKLTNNRWGYTRTWKPTNEPIDMMFPQKTLERPKYFKKVVFPHELGHASKNVYLNPKHNPSSQEFAIMCSRCGQSHPGEGHDGIWHDEFDRLKKEVEEE